MVTEFKAIADQLPALTFVFQGTVAQGESFFGAIWPEARAVSDARRHLYHNFGLERMSAMTLLKPELISCAVRATMKGHRQSRTIGDPWMLPGIFLVNKGELVWRRDFRHSGDLPDFDKLTDEISARLKTHHQDKQG